MPATSALIDPTLRAAGVPYLNYATQPLPRINRSVRFWRDATHLNTLGVAAQNQVLARQVAQPRQSGLPEALAGGAGHAAQQAVAME